jgi:hypothetical protein
MRQDVGQAAAVPAIAATAGESSSDENLVERIATGDRSTHHSVPQHSPW